VNERYAQVGMRVDGTVKELAWPNIPGQQAGNLNIIDELPGELVGLLRSFRAILEHSLY
jgi:hypothetical protein